MIKSQENFNIAAYHFAKITFVPPQHSFRRLNFKPLLLYIVRNSRGKNGMNKDRRKNPQRWSISLSTLS